MASVTATGIGEADDIDFGISPNPANNQLTIQTIGAIKKHCKIELYDIFGCRIALLFEGIPQSDQMNFDVSNIPAGLYFCSLSRNNSIDTQKIIIGSNP